MKAQSNLIGFLILIGIGLSIITTVFLWALPAMQSAQNQDEVFRLENRMIELNNAIKKAANEQGMLTVPFTIKKGMLYLGINNSIVYAANFRLPQAYQERILLGNKTNVFTNGLYETGILGRNEPAYLMEKGAIELTLRYLLMNDTSTGKCYQIKLTPGNQATAGRGDHTIFVKWVDENTTTVSGCNTTIQEIINIDME